jgi:hypothetical protein
MKMRGMKMEGRVHEGYIISLAYSPPMFEECRPIFESWKKKEQGCLPRMPPTDTSHAQGIPPDFWGKAEESGRRYRSTLLCLLESD